VDNDFFSAASSGVFMNSSFGTFSLIAANLPNPPIYPVAALGARLAVQLAPRVTVQTAIYDGDSGAQDVNKNGLDFRLNAGDGALIFSEINFNLHASTTEKALAGNLKIGSFAHTQHRPTWPSQSAGETTRGSADYGFYGVAEHDLYRGDTRKITAFLRGGGAPGNRNVIGWYADVGVNITGLLPSRADDVAGLAFPTQLFRGASATTNKP
jgi:porin